MPATTTFDDLDAKVEGRDSRRAGFVDVPPMYPRDALRRAWIAGWQAEDRRIRTLASVEAA